MYVQVIKGKCQNCYVQMIKLKNKLSPKESERSHSKGVSTFVTHLYHHHEYYLSQLEYVEKRNVTNLDSLRRNVDDILFCAHSIIKQYLSEKLHIT